MRSGIKLPTSKTIISGTLIWLALGIISVTVVTYTLYPPGPTMGVANSPIRLAFWYQYVLLAEVPLSIFFIYLFTRDVRFRAPPGRYVEGRNYPIFSPYNLAAMAIIAAMYAGISVFTAISNFDLVAAVTAFSAVFFGPIVPFVAVIVGGLIRGGLGGLSFITPPPGWAAFALSDASRWAIGGFIIYRFVRLSPTGLMSYAKWIAVVPLVLLFHFFSVIMSMFTVNPYGPFVGGVTFMAVWYPTTVISVVVGLVVGEAAYRSATRKSRAMGSATTQS